MNDPFARPSWPAFLLRYLRDKRAQDQGIYLHDWSDDAHDLYCGYGLAVSSDVHGGVPYVMYDAAHGGAIDWTRYERIRTGDIVWLRVDDLAEFARRILPRCEERFVLLTTESDWTVPDAFRDLTQRVLDSGKVGTWFSQNLSAQSDDGVMRGIPIGPHVVRKNDLLYGQDTGWRGLWGLRDLLRLDRLPVPQVERAWRMLAAQARPLHERPLRAFADFHLNNSSRWRTYGESRTDIHGILARNPLVEFLPRRLPQTRLLEHYSRHSFVVSPHGGGLDCYRTWEALWMGAIPIVKRSGIDHLYRDLPVAILDDWREMTATRLQAWRDELGSRFQGPRLREVLSMSHWRGQLRQAADALR